MKCANGNNDQFSPLMYDSSENSINSIIIRLSSQNNFERQKLHLNSLIDKFFINKNAFYYFPDKNSIAEIIETETFIQIERKIFGANVEYSKFEKAKIHKFKEYVKDLIFQRFLSKEDFLLSSELYFYFPDFLSCDLAKSPIENLRLLEYQQQLICYLALDNNKKTADEIETNNYKIGSSHINNSNDNNIRNMSTYINNPHCLNFIEDAEILRYLISTEFDFKQAFEALNYTYKWRKENIPSKIFSKDGKINKKIKIILNSGFIYIHGLDNQFRPNIFIRPEIYLKLRENKLDEMNYDTNDWLFASIFVLEFCIKFLLIPGQVESWNIIVDFNNISLISVPCELKEILSIIQKIYKLRLNKIYMMNLTYITSLLLKVAKGLIGDFVDKKFKIIYSYNNFAQLYENICRSQTEKKYGGYCENKSFETFYSENKAIANNTTYENFKKTNNEDKIKVLFKAEVELAIEKLLASGFNQNFISEILFIDYELNLIDLLKKANQLNFNYKISNSNYFLKVKKKIKQCLKILIKQKCLLYLSLYKPNTLDNLLNCIKSVINEAMIFYTNPIFTEADLLVLNNQQPNQDSIMIDYYYKKIKADLSIMKSPYLNYKITTEEKNYNFVSNLRQEESKNIFNCELIHVSNTQGIKAENSVFKGEKKSLIINSLYENCSSNDSLSPKSINNNTQNIRERQKQEENKEFYNKKTEGEAQLQKIISNSKTFISGKINPEKKLKRKEEAISTGTLDEEYQVFNLTHINKLKSNESTKKIVKVFKGFKGKKTPTINSSFKNSNNLNLETKQTTIEITNDSEVTNQEDQKTCKIDCGSINMQCLLY